MMRRISAPFPAIRRAPAFVVFLVEGGEQAERQVSGPGLGGDRAGSERPLDVAGAEHVQDSLGDQWGLRIAGPAGVGHCIRMRAQGGTAARGAAMRNRARLRTPFGSDQSSRSTSNPASLASLRSATATLRTELRLSIATRSEARRERALAEVVGLQGLPFPVSVAAGPHFGNLLRA
jgi:hypothetical protein